MSNQLKDTLARARSLRKKDFANMMKDILSCQDEKEDRVRDLLKTFFEEQNEIATVLKKSLAEGGKIKIDDFREMLQNIQARQKARENEMSLMLKEFQKEYREMAESLSSLVNEKETIQIKDFKKALRNIRSRQIVERTRQVREELDHFEQEQASMLHREHELAAVMDAEKTDRFIESESREREEMTMVGL
ncbi:MAG: hypothetical protein KKH67_14070 [candidate division Zixibacteria bacterium]|nr:hypothetical protein [candidate division Zixibacteria bacterium]